MIGLQISTTGQMGSGKRLVFIQWKKERKAVFFLHFSGFSSPSVMLMPLSNITSDSFDNAVTKANGTSDMCITIFVTTSLIMSAKPDISLKPISDIGKPSRMRKREHPGSLSDLSSD